MERAAAAASSRHGEGIGPIFIDRGTADIRSHMLNAFTQWLRDSQPTRAEIDAEIEATISANSQIAEVV